jgi:hypothetical protein
VFFDLEEAGNTGGVEILIKAGPIFTEDQVHDLRDSLKLGDVVEAAGQLEHTGSHILHLTSIVVLERWRDKHPDSHFIPRCLSLGSEAVAHANENETQPAAVETRETAAACQHAFNAPPSMQHQLNDETVVHQNGGGQPNGEQSAQRQLCKFHINGRCAKGASCPFLHVDVHAAPRVRQAWIADRSGPTVF